MDDEMTIVSPFLRAIVSTVIKSLLKKKGLDGIDIHIEKLNIVRSAANKEFTFNLELCGTCTDETVSELTTNFM